MFQSQYPPPEHTLNGSEVIFGLQDGNTKNISLNDSLLPYLKVALLSWAQSITGSSSGSSGITFEDNTPILFEDGTPLTLS